MSFIVMIIVVIYLILIAWTWQSLGYIEKPKKVAVIALGALIMYIITLIVFSISKSGIDYQNIEAEKAVKNVLVAMFSGINGIIVLPQIAKVLDKINEDDIDKKTASRRFIIIAIIFIICIAFECGYMKSTQEGILKFYNAQLKK